MIPRPQDQKHHAFPRVAQRPARASPIFSLSATRTRGDNQASDGSGLCPLRTSIVCGDFSPGIGTSTICKPYGVDRRVVGGP
jgi:hypothetical protein